MKSVLERFVDGHIEGLQERCHPTWDNDEIGVVPTEQRFGVMSLVTNERI